MTRELVYGRRSVREVARAKRRALLELLVTERALAAEPWLREIRGVRVQVRAESALNAEAGTRDHQGVVAFCEPYRYADAYEAAAGERPLIACLDQVTDPRNLGAVCRSAEGAGATAVVVPEHSSARVTAAVCRASAGAVEHLSVGVVVNLARYLKEVKRGDLWVWAADGGAATRVWDVDFATGTLLVFGSEGRGIRPGVRRACDDAFAVPLRGRVESLNVSVAAGIALFEAARQRHG
ncbi:MAG: 23S rRNA (guanosine(2251)-2'-O)-methyltransferase RlmB [Actinomycetota bacterium]|nr:23S rRNA (guanosine(2251)-2'-O)-methyltransferase RlmB [Actinomycetota bacterium]